MKANEKQQAVFLLTQGLLESRQAAFALRNTPDNGTCCLDLPIFYVKGLSNAVVQRCAEAAGVRIDLRSTRESPWFVINCHTGQAGRRTLMCEAFQKELKKLEAPLAELGVKLLSSVHYVID